LNLVKVIRNGDITAGTITSWADRYFSDAEAASSAVGAGDVLITTSGQIGKCVMGRDGYCASNFVRILRPDSRLIDGQFLMYVLMTPAASAGMQRWSGGSTIQNLRTGFFRESVVNLPPLSEQRRIVAAIDEHLSRMDAATASLGAANRRAGALRNSLLRNAIAGSSEQPIGKFSRVFVGSTPSRRRAELWGGGVPWVSSGEVAFGRISRTRETISPSAVTAGRVHPAGTVLLGMIGEGKTRGQAAILDVPAAHNQNSAAIRLDVELCTPEWLFYVLMARYEVTRRAGSGGQQPALNKSRVESLSVPLPPVGEQRRIVTEIEQRLSAIDELRAAIERSRRKAASLRRAVLERAFRGDLVPQDPTDEPAAVLLERVRAERTAAVKHS
jgi:type I restriction enzyme S subunit